MHIHKHQDYTVMVDGGYLRIYVSGYAHHYQLKLEDEGLVLDEASDLSDDLEPLFHQTHEEALVCPYCGERECDYSCDEAQAGGFTPKKPVLKERNHYAPVHWVVEDVRCHKPDWDLAKCEDWLSQYEDQLQDACICRVQQAMADMLAGEE